MSTTDAKPTTPAAPKMVSCTINGKSVSVPAGTSVIRASLDAGSFIPHYCYHQDLSIAGVCRMCVVEVEKAPKLAISCNTPVAEGMVIRTDTPKVKDAVKNALELHLINHPIDCPICDKAGECKLQDYYADYGLYQSRVELEKKVHKPKAVDIGTIVLDSERCILCTRCVRFTAEVSKSFELGIFNRGDRSELRTFDEGALHNDYTGNLADICPVGALTAKDFRFQCRVWFLEKTPTVCTLCARGCNTQTSVRPNTQTLYRVEPRRNPEVNSSWICDEGRWNYHYVSKENRVKTPLKKAASGWVEETWHNAFRLLKDGIVADAKSIVVGLSTQMTNEELADTVEGFGTLGVTQFVRVVDETVVDDRKPYDGVLRHRDLTANAAGFERVMKQLGVKWLKKADVAKLSGLKQLILVGLEGEILPGVAALLETVPSNVSVTAHASNRIPVLDRCEWILPNVSSYEKSGTLVNALGRAQKLNAALPAQFTARDAHGFIFGLVRGADREAVSATRFREVYETTTSKVLFSASAPKWFSLKSEGISLEGAEG